MFFTFGKRQWWNFENYLNTEILEDLVGYSCSVSLRDAFIPLYDGINGIQLSALIIYIVIIYIHCLCSLSSPLSLFSVFIFIKRALCSFTHSSLFNFICWCSIFLDVAHRCTPSKHTRHSSLCENPMSFFQWFRLMFGFWARHSVVADKFISIHGTWLYTHRSNHVK